jgi:pantetheine-phosphate adenylyltransferase
MPERVVYTGSFDPITLGHINVIERGAKLTDELIVGVGTNIEKRALFTIDERVEFVRRTTGHVPNVRVKMFTGLAVQLVRQCNAHVILRGVRTLSDMESEFTMILANRKLDPEIETIILMADNKFSHISSSLIKQITTFGTSDKELAQFVPKEIIPDLRGRLERGSGKAGGIH